MFWNPIQYFRRSSFSHVCVLKSCWLNFWNNKSYRTRSGEWKDGLIDNSLRTGSLCNPWMFHSPSNLFILVRSLKVFRTSYYKLGQQFDLNDSRSHNEKHILASFSILLFVMSTKAWIVCDHLSFIFKPFKPLKKKK